MSTFGANEWERFIDSKDDEEKKGLLSDWMTINVGLKGRQFSKSKNIQSMIFHHHIIITISATLLLQGKE